MHFKSKNPAFITLLSVLISMAIGVSISVSVLTLGLGFSRNALLLQQSSQAKALANACAEKALEELREAVIYTGNETVNLGQGSCQILTILGSGNTNRTVQVIGTVNNIVRKIEVEVSVVSPQIQLTDWQEVSDF